MSIDSEFLPVGALQQQVWAVANHLDSERQQAVAQAKAVYTEVFGRRHNPEPGDGPRLWQAARVIWPLLDRPEAERDSYRMATIQRDLEKSVELDRLEANARTLRERADGLEHEAKRLEADADALARTTAGLTGPAAARDRWEASSRAAEARQKAEEADRRARRAESELRDAQAPHARLCGRVW